MSLFTQKRTVVLGGLKIDVFFKNGEVKKTEIFGHQFKSYESIKFSSKFLEHLSKKKSTDVVNLDNPLTRKQLGDYVVDKEIEKIFKETSKYLHKFESKNNKTAISQILETGLLNEEDVLAAVKALNKPVGLKGLMYNFTKGVATYLSNYSKKFRGEVYNKKDFQENYKNPFPNETKLAQEKKDDTLKEIKNSIDKLSKNDLAALELIEELKNQLEAVKLNWSNYQKEIENISTQKENIDKTPKDKKVKSDFKEENREETLKDFMVNTIIKKEFNDWNRKNPENLLKVEEKATVEAKQKELYLKIKNQEISLDNAKKELLFYFHKVIKEKELIPEQKKEEDLSPPNQERTRAIKKIIPIEKGEFDESETVIDFEGDVYGDFIEVQKNVQNFVKKEIKNEDLKQ